MILTQNWPKNALKCRDNAPRPFKVSFDLFLRVYEYMKRTGDKLIGNLEPHIWNMSWISLCGENSLISILHSNMSFKWFQGFFTFFFVCFLFCVFCFFFAEYATRTQSLEYLIQFNNSHQKWNLIIYSSNKL